jgi:hypothetical protein
LNRATACMTALHVKWFSSGAVVKIYRYGRKGAAVPVVYMCIAATRYLRFYYYLLIRGDGGASDSTV